MMKETLPTIASFKISPVSVGSATANFDALAESVKNKIDALGIAEMEDTEENIKTLKAIRSELNKEKDFIESQRKDVEKIIFADYVKFVDRYKREIKKIYDDADDLLKSKITIIDKQRLQKKIDYAKDYFAKCKEVTPLPILNNYEDIPLSITLSSTDASIRKAITDHVDKVSEAVKVISSYPDEAMLEPLIEAFINTRSITDAIRIVNTKTLVPESKSILTEESLSDIKVKRLKLSLELFVTETDYRKVKQFLEAQDIMIISECVESETSV